MQHRKTVSLTGKDEQFISAQIEAGEYGNASEVVRAGLRLLEQQQLKLASLRQAIKEGDAALSRGEFSSYAEPGQLATEFKARLLKRQAAKRD